MAEYDVAVIGGGAAGMMAAGTAAACGARVVIIEKNSVLGKKLSITGGGRCNILNAEFDSKKLVAKYGPKGKALFSSFDRFGVEDTIKFFEDQGLPIVIESEKRAFPKSNRAEDVCQVMIAYMKKGSVTVQLKSPVQGLSYANGLLTGVVLERNTITADTYIMTTGGKSHPETGSTGEGFDWMREIGHEVEDPDVALVPITIHEAWVKNLSGMSFLDVKLTALQNGKKLESRSGKMLMTHFGISGPMVLNFSKTISEYMKDGPVELLLNLYPTIDQDELDQKILTSFTSALNKKIKNSFGETIPHRIIATVLSLVNIDPEKETRNVSRLERLQLVKILQALPMTVSGFLGAEKAVITSGGVSLKEIDFKTMQSKLYSNLYLAGDIINFDKPTGGFNLQICWTTGYLAGKNSFHQKSI